MGATTFNYVDNTLGLVQTFWKPIVEKELRENTLWVNLLLDPNYVIENVRGGDTLVVSRINKPTSTIRTIGTDAGTFDTNILSSTSVNLQVSKRCVSAYEFEDLAVVMSQLEQTDSEIRNALVADLREQANDYIKSLISPSTSSPDHSIASVTDFNNTQLVTTRTLASQAKWQSSGEPWYLVADPSYVSDMLKDTTITNAQYMMDGQPSPAVAGAFVAKRHNFMILEDNSLSTDVAYAFIPSFMKVITGAINFKLAELTSNKQFGYILVADMVLGAIQQDNTRVIKTYNT